MRMNCCMWDFLYENRPENQTRIGYFEKIVGTICIKFTFTISKNNVFTGRIIPPTEPHASPDEPIAFYAYMSDPMTSIGGHHILTFNVIETNSGLGLLPTYGVFAVQKSGFYVFTWTIRVNGYHGVELVVNGQAVGALYQHTGSEGGTDMSSTTAIVHANEGEYVFLRTKMDYNHGVIYSSDYGRTSFAGWKLV